MRRESSPPRCVVSRASQQRLRSFERQGSAFIVDDSSDDCGRRQETRHLWPPRDVRATKKHRHLAHRVYAVTFHSNAQNPCGRYAEVLWSRKLSCSTNHYMRLYKYLGDKGNAVRWRASNTGRTGANLCFAAWRKRLSSSRRTGNRHKYWQPKYTEPSSCPDSSVPKKLTASSMRLLIWSVTVSISEDSIRGILSRIIYRQAKISPVQFDSSPSE